jgi:calcium/calmodulin-dependent protein kinase IV
MALIHTVVRSLVSLVRSSGIRKDYHMDDTLEIGRGRYGVVLQAKRNADGESVAIKKITKKGRSAQAMENIRNEIEVMKRVKHPHCISLCNVYESANHVYIVMELARGGELLDRIINKEHYTESEAAKCFIQISSAIQYLHSQGIVHRDLKPENILYTETSKDSAIKLADYGLSRCFDADDLNHGRIRMMSRCGSSNFVAPEVVSGSGYGKSCDIWSAGVVLYILLCGFLPFDAAEPGSRGKMTFPVISLEVDFPKPYWDHMSDASKDLVRRMLVIDPKARITTEKVLQHSWTEMYRQGTLSHLHMPQMQQRLKDHVVTRKLLGAINSLAALRNMQLAEVDWDRIHRIMRKMAVDCLSKIKLDPTREAELREGFGLLDRDNTGKISLSNLEDSMRALGHLRSQEEVDFMMKRFDLYQTGDISFEEYCVMMSVPPDFLHNNWTPELMMTEKVSDDATSAYNIGLQKPRSSEDSIAMECPVFTKRCLSEEEHLSDLQEKTSVDQYLSDLQKNELLESFKALDLDGSGFIVPQNIKEVLSRLGSSLTDEEARKMVEIADYNQNGVIEFDEFVALVTSP